MSSPVYNPPIPFLGVIPGGFMPGKMVRVQGSVPYNAQRFAINLQCGPNTDPRDDIALHINFRFPENCVVRNHLQGLSWGPEETSGGQPLRQGVGFEALILCEPNSIKMALNGLHFCEFIHRLPYQRISHITIDGEVQITSIIFEGTASAPPPQPQYMPQGGYGAPQPGFGVAPPPYTPAQPVYGQPMMTSQPQMMSYGGAMGPQHQRSGGVSTAGAVGIGAAGLAAGGLAGYALAGGFSGDDNDHESVHVVEDAGGDFGGDDWME